MKKMLLLLLLGFSILSNAKSLNKIDESGQKHGYWEEGVWHGSYKHGKKTGIWYEVSNQKRFVTYKNGMLNGAAYNGMMTLNFYNGNLNGSIVLVDDHFVLSLKFKNDTLVNGYLMESDNAGFINPYHSFICMASELDRAKCSANNIFLKTNSDGLPNALSFMQRNKLIKSVDGINAAVEIGKNIGLSDTILDLIQNPVSVQRIHPTTVYY